VSDKEIILNPGEVLTRAVGVYGCVTEEVENKTDNWTGDLPPHLGDLFDRSCRSLQGDEVDRLKTLLIEFEDVFARDEFDLGNFDAIEHSIDTGEHKPVKQRMRRTPVGFEKEEEAHLQKMLDAGVIRPSISEWASAPVLVRKRDGGVRWCIDYRELNSRSVKDVFPLPLVEECLDTLAGNIWYSKLDANSAYWQVKIREEDRGKTAFITKYGLFEFARMAFGLCNSPATYARVINLVLRGLTWRVVLAFLDDILVLGKTFKDHLDNLRAVFLRIREYGLKLKPKKCDLFKQEVEFLGRVVGPEGMRIGPGYIKDVQSWPVPTSSKDVERFLGFVNYHRSFIKELAHRASPLQEITGKKLFRWEDEHQVAFDDLVTALTTAPVLAIPNAHDTFILDTDASAHAIGAELVQVQEGRERVICYSSYTLSPEQRRYCTTRRELLAIIRFTRQFRHYLLGRKFFIRTDHNSLTWLLRFKDPQGQLARWIEELSQFDMEVKYRPGSKHANADALSRLPGDQMCPDYRLGVDLKHLPCGGCTYCVRAYEKWGDFVRDVDDVVPLAQKAEVASVKSNQPENCIQVSKLEIVRIRENTALCRDSGEKSTVRVVHEPEGTGISMGGYTEEQLGERQKQDQNLAFLIQWLKTREDPGEGNLFLSSPEAKFYWLNRQVFVLNSKGVLMRERTDKHPRRLVVPDSCRTEILQLSHDIPAAGHQGVQRTKELIKQKYYWKGLGADVEKYILGCSQCNMQKKPNRHAKHPLTKYQAGAPMERVHLDFVGPLPRTDKGNEYILMMVDQFTKWVECIPLPSQTAEETARAAVNEFFSRFGYPFQVYSDQGRNFESALFKELCDLVHIHKARTTPYRPSSNGQVERFNRTLIAAVRCFVGKNQKSWDIFLPQLAGAIRACVNRSTGYSPNRLMLGREVNKPVDLIFRQPTTEVGDQDLNDYVRDLANALGEAHQAARENLKTSHQTMKKYYDLRVRENQYSVGDMVYRLDTATIKGKSRKLSPVWKGPGVIIDKLTPYLYRVQEKKMIITANHDRLKLFQDREVPTWASQLAEKVKRQGQNSDTYLSKTMLFILRHGAQKLGYNLLPGGFLYVEDILQKQGDLKDFTLEDVKRVVQSDSKQRLCIVEEGGSLKHKIRANQGHSMQIDDLELEPILRAADCTEAVHGTTWGAYESIMQQGLSRMGRNHVHFMQGNTEALKRSKEILIYLDVPRALDEGLQLLRAKNGIILCPGDQNGVISPRFFKEVYRTKPWELLHCQETQGRGDVSLGIEPPTQLPGDSDNCPVGDGEAELFCVCRGPYQGDFMVQCDTCFDWFHGRCVDITLERAEGMDKFTCPRCPPEHLTVEIQETEPRRSVRLKSKNASPSLAGTTDLQKRE
jgi:RNA:NAD 2'-phosphotransferase (TPT1/KptA family)